MHRSSAFQLNFGAMGYQFSTTSNMSNMQNVYYFWSDWVWLRELRVCSLWNW